MLTNSYRKIVNLDDFIGEKAFMANSEATWCNCCLKEMPDLEMGRWDFQGNILISDILGQEILLVSYTVQFPIEPVQQEILPTPQACTPRRSSPLLFITSGFAYWFRMNRKTKTPALQSESKAAIFVDHRFEYRCAGFIACKSMLNGLSVLSRIKFWTSKDPGGPLPRVSF